MATLPISSTMGPALLQLKSRLQQLLMDYDYEEQGKRRQYENSLNDTALSRVRTLREQNSNLADRGLNKSGIALQADADTNLGFDTKNAAAAADLNAVTAMLARKRLAAQQDYDVNYADLLRQSTLARTK